METEIWKDIPWYEWLYQVSNIGRVKSMDRFSIYLRKWKILLGRKDKDWYIWYDLYKEGKYKTYKWHRIVANIFIDNPFLKPTVNHINGVKYDNRVCNLEWATLSEQQRHRYDILKCKWPNTGRFGNINKLSKPVLMLSTLWVIIKEFDSASSAARFIWWKQWPLSSVARWEKRIYMWYIWKYK